MSEISEAMLGAEAQRTTEGASHSTGIGHLAEGSLHAALKAYLARPGDRFEARLGRYVIASATPC
jgi:hypothetical protein